MYCVLESALFGVEWAPFHCHGHGHDWEGVKETSGPVNHGE